MGNLQKNPTINLPVFKFFFKLLIVHYYLHKKLIVQNTTARKQFNFWLCNMGASSNHRLADSADS